MSDSHFLSLKPELDEWVTRANSTAFIEDDPIQIPHLFVHKRDVEIAGFFAAILSWGQRKTIISKGLELMARMDQDPAQFVLHATDSDLQSLVGFKHRTFNDTDLLYLVDFFRRFYTENDSLELFFTNRTIREGLIEMHRAIFASDYAPNRTRKHISTPLRNSACKRLNMFLRWMVRRDSNGVDFGIWSSIKPSMLMIPLDVHVQRVALELKLLQRPKADWQAVEELTMNLRRLDPIDPVRYDFALFYMGLNGVNSR